MHILTDKLAIDYIGVMNNFQRRIKEHSNNGQPFANSYTHSCQIVDDWMTSDQAYQRESLLILNFSSRPDLELESSDFEKIERINVLIII